MYPNFFFLLSRAISHAVTPQIYFSTPWKGPDPHAGNHWLNAIMPLNKDPSLCPLSKSGELMISIQTHIQHTKNTHGRFFYTKWSQTHSYSTHTHANTQPRTHTRLMKSSEERLWWCILIPSQELPAGLSLIPMRPWMALQLWRPALWLTCNILYIHTHTHQRTHEHTHARFPQSPAKLQLRCVLCVRVWLSAHRHNSLSPENKAQGPVFERVCVCVRVKLSVAGTLSFSNTCW